MLNCPELAEELKKRRARWIAQPTANLVDIVPEVDDNSDSDDCLPPVAGETDLATNFTKLNLAQSSKNDEEWYLDSRALRHITGRRKLLTNLKGGSHSTISTAGGEQLSIADRGPWISPLPQEE